MGSAPRQVRRLERDEQLARGLEPTIREGETAEYQALRERAEIATGQDTADIAIRQRQKNNVLALARGGRGRRGSFLGGGYDATATNVGQVVERTR